MIDISFTGGTVDVSTEGGLHTTITEFSDDGSPVEVDEIEVTGTAVNMNNLLIRWRKPAVYTVKVNVIPNSTADVELTRMLDDAHTKHIGSNDGHNGGAQTTPINDLRATLVIKAPAINGSSYKQWTFSEGTIVSGTPSVSSDAEGKMQAKTYSFVFEKMVEGFNNLAK